MTGRGGASSAARFDPEARRDVEWFDVEYARPEDTPLLARVYRPRGDDGPWPLLIDVHGGAWSMGDRTIDVHYDEALAASGMVVVALDFRQGPVHRYPSAAADIVAGIGWAKAHAEQLRASAAPAGIVGGSSGGHLAMLVALRPHAPELASTAVDAPPEVDASVAYALALWPILDPPARYRYLHARRSEPPRPSGDRFFRADLLIAGHEGFLGDEATMARASVQRVVEEREFESLPPVFLAHGELDENVTLAMTEHFAAAYRAAGGSIDLEIFAGVGHAFAHFPGTASERCIAQMRAFIARQLVDARRGALL